MISSLTIHIIIKNNEETIEHTLDSISSINAQILIGDLGCKDSTINKCKKHNTSIIKISLNDDLSQVRNHMLKTSDSKWNLYIEPWEILLNGHEIINQRILNSEMAYKFNIIQEDTISKQIRLWHKNMNLKFKNPVFETLTGKFKEKAQDLAVNIASGSSNFNLNAELLEKWRLNNPLAKEPIYYTAFHHLSNKNWDTFLNFADLYLHQEKSDCMSVYMTYYYHAMVNCYIKKNYNIAIKSIIKCIAKKPTMSEFWCLLADIYYALNEYDKAISFYENAILLGNKRLQSDDWPLEISKYKEYPNKMIQGCIKNKQSLRMYKSK